MPDLLLRLAATVGMGVLAPVLVAQGRRVRRTTPRLPQAAGADTGVLPGCGRTLHLLVLGESTAAGVGAADHQEGLAGQVAAGLGAATGRPVRWRVVARNGVTAAITHHELLEPGSHFEADVAVIALGVNDTLRLHSPARWTRDLRELIEYVRFRCGPAPVVLAAVPPMGRFPALPQPLRGVLGLRAALLDRAAVRLAGEMEAVHHVSLALAPGSVEHFFCADRFHPSPHGYAVWGAELGRAAAAALA